MKLSFLYLLARAPPPTEIPYAPIASVLGVISGSKRRGKQEVVFGIKTFIGCVDRTLDTFSSIRSLTASVVFLPFSCLRLLLTSFEREEKLF